MGAEHSSASGFFLSLSFQTGQLGDRHHQFGERTLACLPIPADFPSSSPLGLRWERKELPSSERDRTIGE